MSNSKLPKHPFPISIEIGLHPVLNAAPARFWVRGRYYNDVADIPDDAFEKIIGMAAGLTQALDDEYLRRHPGELESRATLEADFAEWCREHDLPHPSLDPNNN